MNGIRITGGAVITAGVVVIEDCVIDGNFAGAARGISDERVAGGELYISNTTVRNTGQAGIVIIGAGRVDAALDNVRVQNARFGFATSGGAKVMINRSVFTGNSQAGIEADGASVELNVSNSVSSNNAFGVQNLGGTPTIRLSNNDIAFNRTAFTGVINSFTNNRLFGNLELGTSPTPIGQTSFASGLQ